ncbi:hypothetical protein Ksed_26360 [Kytococcus sedentarius DSM 20547]|uniref:Uncharacterized protein n=1 Tax=Kytococcus sedentarius (strain ATCC 14392 / DSM 20547 / JCM 11482 / CCUG 33030 / NBRC 15357 / NCTC 11040 / CCM 314 / 541) TaxID=478801 RepID=C7NGR5_KYTSD|nr:hypothetical protein Ksed_26360 [Kytococcus sedentarius DSM 20547]
MVAALGLVAMSLSWGQAVHLDLTHHRMVRFWEAIAALTAIATVAAWAPSHRLWEVAGHPRLRWWAAVPCVAVAVVAVLLPTLAKELAGWWPASVRDAVSQVPGHPVEAFVYPGVVSQSVGAGLTAAGLALAGIGLLGRWVGSLMTVVVVAVLVITQALLGDIGLPWVVDASAPHPAAQWSAWAVWLAGSAVWIWRTTRPTLAGLDS